VNERSNTAKRPPGAEVRVKEGGMRLLVLSGLVVLSLSGVSAGRDNQAPLPTAVTSRQRWVSHYASLPLRFELNQGQTDQRAKFLVRGLGYNVFLTSDEAVLVLSKPSAVSDQPGSADLSSRSAALGGFSSLSSRAPSPEFPPPVSLRLKLVGANPDARVSGEEKLPGESNYFLGRDPRRWHTNIPGYAKVRYGDLYAGVDLVYYGRQGELEYDFVVAPGADPRAIRLALETGGSKLEDRNSKLEALLRVDAEGDLVVRMDGGEVRFHKPIVYQPEEAAFRGADQAAGPKPAAAMDAANSHLNSELGIQGSQFVDGRYVLLAGNRIGFEVGAYDPARPLVIDPVLSYATYIGGKGGDVAYGIAVDSSGEACITGVTNSADFPVATAEQSKYAGSGDAFVAKLSSDGTKLVYSTYFGGSGSDTAAAIAVDATGDAFITGTTTSSDFPITSTAFQATYGGNGDAFVAELGSAGNQLVYSSYLGGLGADSGQAIAVDSSGDAYVTGSTQSADFPTVSALQPANAGASDAFIAKVNFSGSALLYSTYLGGAQADVGQGIKVDGSGNAFIIGYTFSSDFPTYNPLQAANAGAPDAFVAEVNAAGSALVFSTYLGGSGDDRGYGIALDASGNIYLVGASQSADFPTTSNAFQTGYQGNGDAFVSKLNSTGSALTYSTFLGGTGVDRGNSIVVDSSGNAYITGFTQSSNFPTQNPVQAIMGISGGSSCGTAPCSDAFVTQLNPSGSGLVYSTYLGGSGADFGQGIALDTSGDAYVAGSTSSANFPAIVGAYQGSLVGLAGNAFVAKVDPSNNPGLAIVPPKLNFGNQSLSVRSPVQTITIINAGTAALSITSITSSSTDFAETDNCVGTIAGGGGTCAINVTYTPSAVGSVTDELTVTDNASGSPHTITLTGTGVTAATAVTVSPTSLTFANQNVGTVSAAQTVTITNTGTAVLSITQISVSGDFSQTNTCSAKLNILNVGESCAVSVAFAPAASGARSGSLSISDNATGSPQTVALSGTGLAVFSLSATSPATTVLIGSTSATFTISASAPSGFTGSVTLSCSSVATCAFSASPIFAGQSSTLTVSSLTASTPNPFNFTVNGTSGSQNATLSLSILFADYALTATPSLNTITSGGSANYSLIVTPSNGFNQQVSLTCSGLPSGAGCAFSSSSVTPNGSAVTVTLTVNTTKSTSTLPPRWRPRGGAPPPLVLWLVCLGILASLFCLHRRLAARPAAMHRLPALWPKLAVLSLVLALAALWGSCRSSTGTSGTPTGNYTITVNGTLNSNTTVVRTTTINLAVT
jgi:hypothetical protein